MKYFFLPITVVLCSLFSFCTFGQSSTVKGAVIEFVKEEHVYGTIPYGSNGDGTFELCNRGDKPLIILEVKGTCPCIAHYWPKEVILPGDSAVINVFLDTKSVGPVLKTLTVYSNAVNEPVKVIRIKGNVLAAENGTPVNKTGAPSNN